MIPSVSKLPLENGIHLVHFFGKMVTTPFHALGVQPNQILVLRFPPRPNFAFLVGWGAPRLISWSFQHIPVTGVAPQ